MTHEGILKINELFNNKLSKKIDNIRMSLTYVGNFSNQLLFQNLRKVVKRAGYENVKGQIDTLYCIIDGLKSADINDAVTTAALSGSSKAYLPTKETIDIFKSMLTSYKITFDDRIRRDNDFALYLTDTHFCIKTGYFTLAKHKEIFRRFIYPLMLQELFICKQVEYKIESSDFYHQVYDNAKTVINNMNSRGISLFAIACYFWIENRDFIPKPFMHHWSNLNFMQALMSTTLYATEAKDELKQILVDKPYWTVLGEYSLLTGRVNNFDNRRKELNIIINKVLNSEGEEYIKDYLKQLKLVASQNPVKSYINVGNNRDVIKNIEAVLHRELREKTTLIPPKEAIIEAIKYQFMISRVLDIDFSSKRKDHIVFDKGTRKRVLDIL